MAKSNVLQIQEPRMGNGILIWYYRGYAPKWLNRNKKQIYKVLNDFRQSFQELCNFLLLDSLGKFVIRSIKPFL